MARIRCGVAGGLILAAIALTPAARAQEIAPPPVVATVSTAAPGAPIVKPRRTHGRGDPLEGVNRALFSVHQLLDRIIFRPVAFAYKAIVPKPLRTGIRHVFSNLGEPIVFANDVLQLKPRKAIKTLGRFAINSTLGVGGVIDVARSEGLPHRPNGFGDTLGRYGVGPGPYLFLPMLGPTDLRDLAGGQADGLALPLVIGKPFDRAEYIVPRAVLTGLDQRVEADADLKTLLGGAADPYATLRSVYLQNRAAEIGAIRGGTTGGDAGALDDPLADPEAPAGGAGAPATETPADPEAAPAPPPPP